MLDIPSGSCYILTVLKRTVQLIHSQINKEARQVIKIDYRDARPIYEQVVDGIEGLALRGALPADTQLPSVRQLAMELSINPNTIQRAYGELERRGVIYAAKGRGNFISDNAAALRSQRLNELGEQITALAGQARSLGATEEQLRGWVERKGESRT
jgi:GntR family transcriptional regulator